MWCSQSICTRTSYDLMMAMTENVSIFLWYTYYTRVKSHCGGKFTVNAYILSISFLMRLENILHLMILSRKKSQVSFFFVPNLVNNGS